MLDKTKENYRAFWANEGACFYVTALKRKFDLPQADSLEQKWLDGEFIVKNLNTVTENTYFGGDAFPSSFVNLGPGVMSTFLENPYKLAHDTVWFDVDPMIKFMDGSLPTLVYNKDNETYKQVYELTKYTLKNSAKDILVGMTDLGGGLDILASLRGSENLLYDLYDYPEQIHSLMREIDTAWELYFEDFASLLMEKQDGMATWMPIWNDRRWYALQCDFCAMISPESFCEFVLPCLTREAEFLDNAVYHLDGPGELCHLDYILDIEKINAIQWTSGAGNADVGSAEWFDLYKKIQSKNKGLVLLDVQPEYVINIFENLSHKGLYVKCECKTYEDAVSLEKQVNKILRR